MLRTRLRRKSRFLIVIVVSFGLLGFLYLERNNWLPWLFDYLAVGQSPVKADYLIILSGNEFRTQKAIDLYQAGFAPVILVSACSSMLDAHLSNLYGSNIPRSSIVVNDETNSTWDEAKEVLNTLSNRGARSALIVTDPPHLRRARATYQKLNTSGSIQLTFTSSSVPWTRDNWWKSPDSRAAVLEEYLKMIFYYIRYGVASW